MLAVLDDAGLWLVDPAGLELESLPTPLDPLTPVSRLRAPLPQGDRTRSRPTRSPRSDSAARC